MSKAVHIAVIRRVKSGREAEFKEALHEFFQTSFAQIGMHGACMLVPPPWTKSPEFGILRSFANKRECDAFYSSPMFNAWKERIEPLVEGEPVYRQLDGLEAWFRSPQNPPPRWKMAFLTWIAVWPVSMAVPAALMPLIGSSITNVLFAGLIAGGIVVILTWVAMPLLVKLAGGWLNPPKPQLLRQS